MGIAYWFGYLWGRYKRKKVEREFRQFVRETELRWISYGWDKEKRDRLFRKALRQAYGADPAAKLREIYEMIEDLQRDKEEITENIKDPKLHQKVASMYDAKIEELRRSAG